MTIEEDARDASQDIPEIPEANSAIITTTHAAMGLLAGEVDVTHRHLMGCLNFCSLLHGAQIPGLDCRQHHSQS